MGKLNILFLVLFSSLYAYVFSVSLLEGPTKTDAAAGSDVVLRCVFDTYATSSCNWILNSSAVSVPLGRYKFNGNTSAGDCSLKIYNVTANDEGYWLCEFKQSSYLNTPIKSEEIWMAVLVNPGLSTGAIAGIVIGCVLAVIIIGAVTYYCVKKSKERKHKGDYKVKGDYMRGTPKTHSEIRVEESNR